MLSTGLLWGLFAGFLFGTGDVLTRLGIRTAGPYVAAVITSSVVFAAFAAAVCFRGLGAEQSWTAALWYLLMGICSTGPGRLLFYFSVRRIGVSRASVLVAFTPLFSILIAVVFLGERPSIFLLAGALLIVGGIVNVVMDRSKIRIHLRTALLGLLPALVYSTSPVFMRLGLLALPDRILGNAISGLGALFFMFSMTPVIPRDNRWNVDRRAFPTFLAAGVFYSTAFFAYFSAMGASSVSFTTPLIYTMALFSALISRIFFQQLEQITWRLAISAVVVCIGIALISISRGG